MKVVNMDDRAAALPTEMRAVGQRCYQLGIQNDTVRDGDMNSTCGSHRTSWTTMTLLTILLVQGREERSSTAIVQTVATIQKCSLMHCMPTGCRQKEVLLQRTQKLFFFCKGCGVHVHHHEIHAKSPGMTCHDILSCSTWRQIWKIKDNNRRSAAYLFSIIRKLMEKYCTRSWHTFQPNPTSRWKTLKMRRVLSSNSKKNGKSWGTMKNGELHCQSERRNESMRTVQHLPWLVMLMVHRLLTLLLFVHLACRRQKPSSQ